MSIGPLGGLNGNVAGAQQDSTNQQRQVISDAKAEAASGIGATDAEDQQAHERDADGRRLWEEPPGGKEDEQNDASSTEPPRKSRDPSGDSGNTLDLSG